MGTVGSRIGRLANTLHRGGRGGPGLYGSAGADFRRGPVQPLYEHDQPLLGHPQALALYKGAHAKDYAQREYKGLYALADIVPGVGMFCHDAHASSDAMGYIQANGTTEEIKEGYRTVCPVYAADAMGPFAAFTGLPLIVPTVAAGHVVAEAEAVSIEKRRCSVEAPPGGQHAAPTPRSPPRRTCRLGS